MFSRLCARGFRAAFGVAAFVFALAAAGTRPATTPLTRPAPAGRIDLTIVVDQVPFNPAFATEDALAVLVETGGRSVLFDAGGSALVDHLRRLGKDPRRIDAVVISHVTSDHLNGLAHLLAENPDVPVYWPQTPDEGLWQVLAARPRRILVTTKATEIVPGITTTGALVHDKGGFEQGVVIETAQGPVLLAACGHPGHVAMARRAMGPGGGPLLMVAGGFHFAYDARPYEKLREVAALRALAPRYVAPFHCAVANPEALRMIARSWGPACLRPGVGAIIRIGPAPAAPQVLMAPVLPPAGRKMGSGPIFLGPFRGTPPHARRKRVASRYG